MGWKNIKEQFKIEHNMQITDKGLCIGSGYVHDLATIDLKSGHIKENPTFSGFLKEHYPEILEANSEQLLKLLQVPDSFIKTMPVFTYDGANIIEEQAENFGYPNTTCQGNLMYENTYFRSKKEALAAAFKNNQASLNFTKQTINDSLKKISDLEKELFELQKNEAILTQEIKNN